MRNRTGNILLGFAWLVLIVIVYPSAEPAAQSFVDAMLGVTSVTSGFDYFIISTIPFWGLVVGVLGCLWVIYTGSRRNRL